MLFGSLMLFKSTPSISVHLPLNLILSVTFAISAFFIFAIYMAIRTHTTKVTTGKEGITGETGVAVTNIDPDGQVKVHGEYWKATSQTKIKKNDKISVVKVDGLLLTVEKLEN